MKKFLAMLFVFALLIVGGLSFFIVHSFNANAFQQQVVQGVSELTGRDFAITGETQVSWFPAPQIIMHDVTLSNVADSMYRSMLEAKTVTVQFDLISLLKEPLVINRIEIEEPKIYMERLTNTETNWNFPFLFVDVNDNLERELMAGDINQTRINALTIKNGTLEYDNRVNKTEWKFQNVNGSIVLDSLQGPYTFNGTFDAFSKTVAAQLRLDRLKDDAPVRFQMNLSGEDGNFSLDDVNGTILIGKKSVPKITADGSFNVTRPNDFLKLLNLKPLDPSLNVPSMGSFGYETDSQTESLKNFIIRFGNQEDSVALSGSVNKEEKDNQVFYSLTVAVNRLDYAQWQNILSDVNLQQLTDEKLPNVTLKFNIKDFLWQKEKVQNFSADLIKKNNRFSVENGKALLTGNTAVTFSGGTLTQDDKIGLDLLIAASSDNAKELLSHYVDVKNIADNLLTKVKFNGRAAFYSNGCSVDIQSLEVDKSKLSGSVSYEKTKELPNMAIRLNIDSIDFDAYSGYQVPKEAADITKSVTLIKDYLKNAAFLTKFNGPLDLTLKNVRFHALPMEEAVLKASVNGNVLKVDSFETTKMANAALTGSGEFSGVGTEKIGISNMKIDFKTDELGLFMGKVHLKTDNAFLKNLKAFEMNLDIAESDNIWNVALQSKAANMETSFSGKVDTLKDTAQYRDMNVYISYPNFSRFMSNIVGYENANSSLSGLMKLNATVNGTAQDFNFTNAVLQIGQNQLNLEGHYTSGENALLDMTVSAPSFDVNKYIWNDLKNISLTGLNAQKPLQLSKLDKLNQHIIVKTAQLLYDDFEVKNAVLETTLNNQTLTLKNLTGTVGTKSAPIELNGTLSWQKEPEVVFDFKMERMPLNNNIITLKNMSVGDGVLSANGHLTAKGASPAEMMAHLNGKGHFDWQNFTWVGTNIEKIAPLVDRAIQNRIPQATFDKALLRLLTSGKTLVESVSGDYTVDNGRFQAMDSALKGKGFLSDPMQVIWNISARDLDISTPLSLTERPDYPPFALSLKGKIGQLLYQTNYVDLSASVADVVRADNEQIEQKKQVAAEEKATQARTEREEKARQAVQAARQAVQTASAKVKTGDNSRALQLLQSAQDALEFMNNLSIKENLTDAEYIQLTEQSRLAVLKADEAVAEATNDKFFDDRKFIRAMDKQATAMQREIERISADYPDIEIVQKLVPLTAEYAKTLSNISASLPMPNETDEEHLSHMNRSKTAYLKVLKGYQYVLRFDPEAVPMTPLLTDSKSAASDEEANKSEPVPLAEISQSESKADEETAAETNEELSDGMRARIRGHISREGENDTASSEGASADTIAYSEETDSEDEAIRNLTVGTGMRGSIRRSD